MQRFTELRVWQRSHQLVLEIYQLTEGFPQQELYGVTSQLRRAAVSVPSNIAEGSKRKQPQDYARFLNIAESSLCETEYFIILSRDLGYLDEETALKIFQEIDEIARMLNALRERVERSVKG
jgi:four helix bundle protein